MHITFGIYLHMFSLPIFGNFIITGKITGASIVWAPHSLNDITKIVGFTLI